MTYILSVLDLSPVSGSNTQAQAVRESLEVAKAAERLGYHRFWVAEHHNIGGLGSPAPEILIAAASQITSTIRLGSGGVMLVNYSPLKVAEVFMELEALAPGRIDLGVGRALGADQRTGGALKSSGSEAFPQYFALLSAWLLDASGVEPITDAHPAREIHANPAGPSHPDLFLLCTSVESAIFAAQAGVGMVFAEFIARADGGPAVAAYKGNFRPSVFRSEPWAGIATITNTSSAPVLCAFASSRAFTVTGSPTMERAITPASRGSSARSARKAWASGMEVNRRRPPSRVARFPARIGAARRSASALVSAARAMVAIPAQASERNTDGRKFPL